MKKNLLVLLILLAGIAVISRLGQGAEKDLEKHLQSSLQTLWQQPQPEAHVQGGVASVAVNMPSTEDAGWNKPLIEFVCKRHPQVPVNRIDLSVGGTPSLASPPSPQLELERRQGQALADSLFGADQSLVLLKKRTVVEQAGNPPVLTPPQEASVSEVSERANEAPPQAIAGRPYQRAARVRNVPEPLVVEVRDVCLVVWNQPESKALERWKSGFHLLPEKGETLRLVTLP